MNKIALAIGFETVGEFPSLTEHRTFKENAASWSGSGCATI